MIDYHGSDMQIVCDQTNKRHKNTYDRSEFLTMIAEAKADGWRIVQKKGEWRHYHPDCALEEIGLPVRIDLE